MKFMPGSGATIRPPLASRYSSVEPLPRHQAGLIDVANGRNHPARTTVYQTPVNV